ncbi:hypothetical protein KI659_18250 [Litoribacter alkaliphilus]|uniref:Methylamine utilisation protein MauE domain-containing protein n=1 Tax=Litoribacter ruber TaxID=702568 RepID=A0AAP2G6Q8_9BACT|nr:MauE/DoxX family redox-associated membrane protein [Litoribacter alkaliphilus]MBS9525968.1 hypothetical protein [Litoribacter alkaliphilus]
MDKIRNSLPLAASVLLILLWGYTGIAKLTDFASFRSAMQNQEIPLDWARILAYVIPPVELALAGMLIMPKLRFWGLAGSMVLMTIFSTYVGLVYIGSFPVVPCGCAGIFQDIGWGAHVLINISFVLLALLGLWALNQKEMQAGTSPNSSLPTQRAGSFVMPEE